ncbi:orf29-like protein [Peridroma alphabaculovirus]|uniref:Orf29-like protein n=1 Tax=Peridroma alphabaculovirus TaxID=1346829 RepID=A0A068LKN6_9ABAC|nr:orf29-like protein [Peridroma alphabaculovirus]AIE47864.1 orf29-like protein [Peridroma alphabaculovirus]
MRVLVSTMLLTLINTGIPAPYSALNASFEHQDGSDEDDDINGLFDMIMHEISKIERTEDSDVNYTKMIFGLLVLVALLTFRSKIYRASTCCRRRHRHGRSDIAPLDTITIQELNYNVVIEQDSAAAAATTPLKPPAP